MKEKELFTVILRKEENGRGRLTVQPNGLNNFEIMGILGFLLSEYQNNRMTSDLAETQKSEENQND